MSRLSYLKNYEWILIKFCWGIGHGPTRHFLDCGGKPFVHVFDHLIIDWSLLIEWLVGAGEEMDQKHQLEEQLRAYQDKKRYKKRQIRELQEDLQVTRSPLLYCTSQLLSLLLWKCQRYDSCERKNKTVSIAGVNFMAFGICIKLWKCVGKKAGKFNPSNSPAVQTLEKSWKNQAVVIPTYYVAICLQLCCHNFKGLLWWKWFLMQFEQMYHADFRCPIHLYS